MTGSRLATARLGLIGDNIADSLAPRLHAIAGHALGIAVRYDLLVPAEPGLGFDELFERCTDGSYLGFNVTHPYKERAAARVEIESHMVRTIGAVNLVRVTRDGPRGFNTDYSGFISAYRAKFGTVAPGVVCLLGAGGAGRAIAFALAALGAEAIRLVDIDRRRARDLAERLRKAYPGLETAGVGGGELEEASAEARGIVNCTPVGMVGHEGTPIPDTLMQGAAWAFDAVYTPVHTRFLAAAAAMRLETLNGFELFLHQGLDGLEIHFGATVDEARLRHGLEEPGR